MSVWNDFFISPDGTGLLAVDGEPFQGALLKLASDQALSTAVEDQVDFDTVVYDEGTWFSGGSPGIFTVPVGVTKVRVSFGLKFVPGTTGTRFAALYIDRGSGFARVEAGLPDWRMSPPAADGSQEMSAVSSVIEVTAGDKFRVNGFASQASQSIETDEDGGSYFSIEAVEAVVSSSAQILQTLADGTNISWNQNTSRTAQVTLAGNRTLDNPTNSTEGLEYTLKIIQDATGSRTLAYGSAYKFAGGTPPTLTSAANAVDVLRFWFDGTNYIQIGFLANIS